MKALYLVLAVILIVNTAFAQTIRRVNNNAGITGVNVYSTAQAAHDAAAANDILMIEPSVTSYGDITLTKPLKMYGNGYFLSTNTELKADQRSSTLGNIIFDTGSGGSAIYGLSFSSGSIRGVSNVIIGRCNFNGAGIYSSNSAGSTHYNVSNISIINNFIGNGNGGGVTASFSSTTLSNVIVSNNILSNISGVNAANNQNWLVKNNTFILNIAYVITLDLSNAIFESNLFCNPIPGYTNGWTFTFSNVSYSYNVSYTNFGGGLNGNQSNYPVSSDYVGSGSGISTDEFYQIKSGSSLKTAGSGGAEVGAFGGSTPYVVSGISPIPAIIKLISTGTGSDATPVQVTISLKSND